jgi:uncharacterized protein YidB (DUF937 family)
VGGLGDLVGSLAGGGLDKALDGFEKSGMDDKVESWIGTGANKAIDSEQVKNALGSDQVAEIAGKLGVSPEQAQDAIAEYLPKIVDQVSPDGKLPGGVDLDDALSKLSDA